jgi:hypothetical protein
MPKRSSKDLNQTAYNIVRQSTEQVVNALAEPPVKNPAAVALGRLGGLKGGKARAASMTADQRKAIAVKAAKLRWSRAQNK